MDSSYKTAIKRTRHSAPLESLLQLGKIKYGLKILDFGCGYGKDHQELISRGFIARGYDPNSLIFNDSGLLNKHYYDIVLCTYVLNVVDECARQQILDLLRHIVAPGGKMYITVRRDVGEHDISKKGTHQYYVELPFPIIKENSSYCIYEV